MNKEQRLGIDKSVNVSLDIPFAAPVRVLCEAFHEHNSMNHRSATDTPIHHTGEEVNNG